MMQNITDLNGTPTQKSPSVNVCNICGANYEYRNGKWLCPACGAYKAEEFSGEELTLLYHAAQALRLNSFDMAEDLYADIIKKYPQNSLGYWGFVLSKYGIQYEIDSDGKSVPSCYQSTYVDFRKDPYFQKAVSLAEPQTKAYYTEQAERISEVCREWRQEASRYSYDIFISFKATDDLGNETEDCREMQNLYTALTERGYKVFFSPVSMRMYAGKQYDAYIFNALDKAKVMILYGSRTEYFTSTWISNEWTRYLRKIERGEKDKNSLLIAYDGISPDDLPRPLRHLQALDAQKKTFYLDLFRTIDELMKPKATTALPAQPVPGQSTQKKKKKLSLKAVFNITWIHLLVMLAMVIVAGIAADIAGDSDFQSNPVSNTAMWLFIIGMVAEIYWIPRTLIQAIIRLFRRKRKK